MANLNVTRVEHSEANRTVTVEGTAGSGITVKVLLNPNLSGNPTDDWIFQNFDTITALDKKKKDNAVTFSLVLNAGNNPGPFQVKVVAMGGKGQLIPVPPGIVPLPPGGGGGTPGGTTTLPGGS